MWKGCAEWQILFQEGSLRAFKHALLKGATNPEVKVACILDLHWQARGITDGQAIAPWEHWNWVIQI